MNYVFIFSAAGITDIETEYFGSGLTINLLAYSTLDGILSPQNLTSYPSMNTVMGMLEISDFVIQITGNNTVANGGEYYVTGLAPNNTAKVVNITRACNGYIYKIDTMLRPSELATKAPTELSFGTQMVEIFFGNCPEALDASILSTIPDSSEWISIWEATQMVVPLSNHLLASTIFVPQNEGVAAAGQAVNTPDAVMYNMINGDWCPEELVGYKTKNSVLGEVRGTEALLKFSKDPKTGELLITGPKNTARVLNVTNLCHNIIYTTDVPLLPPTPLPTSSTASPTELPIAVQRHVFCIPPKLNPNALDKPDPTKNPAIAYEQALINGGAVDGSSSSNNTALAIGLGVGIGCAVLLGAGLGFVLVKRRRRKKISATSSKNNHLSTPMSSDQGTGAKLLPSGGSDGTGTGGTPSFACVSDIFGDSPQTTTDLSTTNSALNNKSGASSSSADVGGGLSTGGGGSTPELARLGSLSAGLERKPSTSLDAWDVNPSDLQIALDDAGKPIELGKGTYGTVYRGTIRKVQPAAIKILNGNLGIEATSAFWREAAILKHASRDRNVVQLYGTSKLADGRFLLITELMELGDLRDALSCPERKHDLTWSVKGKSIAIDIARGVTALHAINVIHRDLKSKNVLLTENFTAKVADVGIAAVHAHGYLTASAGQVFGTLAWSAPELLMGERISDKVDIYSLGVILWELATQKVPERGFVEPPPPSEYCPAELSLLIEECTDPDPADRPNATQVYERLLQIPQ
jgi:hypothetical protein